MLVFHHSGFAPKYQHVKYTNNARNIYNGSNGDIQGLLFIVRDAMNGSQSIKIH